MCWKIFFPSWWLYWEVSGWWDWYLLHQWIKPFMTSYKIVLGSRKKVTENQLCILSLLLPVWFFCFLVTMRSCTLLLFSPTAFIATSLWPRHNGSSCLHPETVSWSKLHALFLLKLSRVFCHSDRKTVQSSSF